MLKIHKQTSSEEMKSQFKVLLYKTVWSIVEYIKTYNQSKANATVKVLVRIAQVPDHFCDYAICQFTIAKSQKLPGRLTVRLVVL